MSFSKVQQNTFSGLSDRMDWVLCYNNHSSLDGGDTQAEGHSETDAENCVTDVCCVVSYLLFLQASC